MKKTVQIAFAIALTILSILSIFVHSTLFESIIIGIVIPAFILTIISFIEEIIQRCQATARKFSDALTKIADSSNNIAKRASKIANTESDLQDIIDLMKQENACLKESLDYKKMESFLVKCSKYLSYTNIVAYTILFLCLVLSPYIVEILADINLNSITLWSLAILYLSNELKPDIAGKIFYLLSKHYIKHNSQT